MINRTVSGTLEDEDLLVLSNELNKSFGHPVDENAVKKYKRQQMIIVFAVIAPVVGLFTMIYWQEIFDFIHKIIFQFQNGHYSEGLIDLAFIPVTICLAFFIENFKAKFRKNKLVFSFEEKGIVYLVNKRKDVFLWDVIPQMRILDSGIAFEIKDLENHSFCMLPDRFFKSRMQRDEIISYCNSKIKKV